MGKVNNRGTLVSPRRRLMKATSGVNAKKNRSLPKAPLPPPPPAQSLVLDEDSGFGGDQSLDSESSFLSAPSTSNSSGVSSLSSVLPSLAMVPQAKLLLVSLLQGAGGVQGTSTSQKIPGNVAVGDLSPTMQLTISNGTNQTGITPSAVTSSGADKKCHTSHSVRPLLAAASSSIQGGTGTEVVSEVPVASTISHSNYPTGPVTLGNTGHKVFESKVAFSSGKVGVDVTGEEAQELPAQARTNSSKQMPPLVSFRDISLLSSIRPFQEKNVSTGTSLRCVEDTSQGCGFIQKSAKTNVHHSSSLTSRLSSRSSDGKIELILMSQPEEQHRARYQTEGSRGAVKDRTGLGHPTVKLIGYDKPTTLQVFVGSDDDKVGPHMFYQVCRVSGKNSTPCKERRIEGTAVIETLLEPETEMLMTCDCVGILKERNVDVEHRFKAAVSRGRKKSTKCRLVFRTFITLPNGSQETLQTYSQAIACTQPPGLPEISRKSLSSCSVAGGEEMFIFGKNFLKDTAVIFQQEGAKHEPVWKETVTPDKESLQPIHLIVTVPKYKIETVTEEVVVKVVVSSGGKLSEPHNFTYIPLVTKKEVPGPDTQEEKPLPKGVSPSAFQLSRQYAKTRTLPPMLSDVSSSEVISSSPAKSCSEATAAWNATSPVSVSQFSLDQVSNQKTTSTVFSAASDSTKTSVEPPPKAQSPVRLTENEDRSQIYDSSSDTSSSEFKQTVNEKNSKPESPQNGRKEGVSVENIVELLKVMPSLPTGSNLHNSVLQLVEELIKSMKENISSHCVVVAKTELNDQESPNLSDSQKSVNLPISSASSLSSSQSTQLTDKPQKSVCLPNAPLPQMSLANGTATKINPGTVPPNVSLWPLTLLSMPSLHTVSASPKVARVAPVAVAPTTVVSSPGLARTVRVCVTEAPNISLEPPKKKSRDHSIMPMDYQMIRSNDFVQGSFTGSSLSSTVISKDQQAIPYTPVGSTSPQKVVNNLCGHQENSNATVPSIKIENCRVNFSAPQPALNDNTNLTARQIDETALSSSTQVLYEPVEQSVLHHTMRESTERKPQISVTVSQSMIDQASPETCLPPSQDTSDITQPVNELKSEERKRHSSQALCGSSQMPDTISDSLFSQPSRLCQLVPSAQVVVSSTAESQTTLLSPVSIVTSALTRSDPLLSQSSPVTPMQIGPDSAAPPIRNQAGEIRTSVDASLTSNPATTQTGMQNEVTSAINLSESELLNYFDPNCFDNV